MQSLDLNAKPSSAAPLSPPSPPNFDFSIPCRYFKSSFARSLSLGNASKSLDYDINNYQRHCNYNYNSNSNNNNNNNNNNYNIKNVYEQQHDGPNDCPPLPQRVGRAATTVTTAHNSSGNNDNNNKINKSNAHHFNKQNEANAARCGSGSGLGLGSGSVSGTAKSPPPAIPARRPLPSMGADMQSQQKQQPQQPPLQHLPMRAHLRHVAASAAAPTAAAGSAGHINKVINHMQQQPPQQQQQQQQQPQPPSQQQNNIANDVGCNSNANNRNAIWPRDSNEQDCNSCDETAVKSTTSTSMLDYESTTTITTPTPTTRAGRMGTAVEHRRTPFEVHERTVNVEAVLLQNQVDTLQWQLKQVETSCEMYRAVMEEVARFFDRYHSQKQQQRLLLQNHNGSTEQIARSRSLYHVCGVGGGASGDLSGNLEKSTASGDEKGDSQMRARSSTNFIDLKLAPAATIDLDERHCNALQTANGYSAFKDFTWRRSPKKPKEFGRPRTPAIDDIEEKLNQEAFRLSRTIHNLLNTSTQQPDLTQHRNSLAALNAGRQCKAPTAMHKTSNAPSSNISSNAPSPHLDGVVTPNVTKMTAATASSLAAEMLFLRVNNMRDSRLSLRSSTDSSVHSTSSCAASSSSSASTSSKAETDEEHAAHTHFLHTSPTPLMAGAKHMSPFCTTTEDESGFSSISSFQEVGVPLSSTLLSNAPINGRHLGSMRPQLDDEGDHQPHSLIELNLESRNSTLKATVTPTTIDCPSTHPTNVVGVPLQTNSDLPHRWDTPSKTYRNAHKFQRFSTLSNEDSATVLWV